MAEQKVRSISVYTLCDLRRKREQDETAPIRLVVKFNGKQKIWGLGIRLTKADYAATRKPFIGGNYTDDRKKELTEIKDKIDDANKRARKIVEKMPVFTYEEFERRMFGTRRDTLFTALEAKISDLLKQERVGNASTYQCTLNTLKIFRKGIREREGRSVKIIGGEDIPLTDVSVYFLRDFEQWYLKQTGKNNKPYSPTSVGIYTRNIRVLLNDAVSEGIIAADSMPIGKKKYRIPGSKKRKLALKIDEVAKIMYVDLLKDSEDERFRDLWIFSYLSAGMNTTDIANLRYEDLDTEKITYIRHKTAYKKLEAPSFITVPLTVEIARLIDRWGNKPALPSTYIFPILKQGMSAVEERHAIMAATRSTNHYIKKIAQALSLTGGVSFYTARHSFSTIMKNSGVSVQAISEALGHSSLTVTQSYLKDFEIEEKRNQWVNLIPDRLIRPKGNG
jgi:integrase/recombinase XerD